MSYPLRPWIFVLAFAWAGGAHALDIYKCPQGGFTNDAAAAAKRSCAKVEAVGPSKEWLPLGANDNVTVYAYRASLRPQGKFLKMWVLWSFPAPRTEGDSKPFRSSKVLHYF